jgi:tetratricopeptide (TPR) repeat protein
MLNETDDDLIGDFLEALRLRHLDECLTLLSSLKVRSLQQPLLKPWHTYLNGILTFEVYADWAEAQRIFTELLQTNLVAAMRGRVLYALGRSLDIQGRWDEAIAAFEQSLTIAIELDQIAEKAKAWKHIAISYNNGFTQGDFGSEALNQARMHCQFALDALNLAIDTSPDITWLKGTVWNTLGLINRNLGQWNEAIACYLQDLAICSSLNDDFGIGVSYLNLGEIYQKLGQSRWPQALESCQMALKITRQFNDRYL